MNHKSSIEATKAGFENSFAEGAFYNRQTQDAEHLRKLLEQITLKQGDVVLDLGTGSGYLAFAIAEQNKEAKVTGLDIVEKALEANRERAEKENVKNLTFMSYDGMKLPFEDNSVDYVVSRYVVHHIPALQEMFQEIARVLKKDGRLLIADPTPNEEDTGRFVDAYMQMKKDGHIKFYTEDEFTALGEYAGLKKKHVFMTEIRFPKKRKDAAEFETILAAHKASEIESYQLEITEEEIYITEKVINILFTCTDK